VILARELGITAMRFMVLRYAVMPASRGGKLKTVLQVVAIALYASAFDEALTAALRRTAPSEAPVTAAPPAGSGRRPATAASAPGRRSGPG